MIEFNPTLTIKQTQADDCLLDDKVKRLLYGGAKGGGKSFFFCFWFFLYALLIIKTFNLKPSSNPPHVAWMGRKQATDFTGTTLQTWRTIIPGDAYQLRGGTERDQKHLLINGTVAIDYGGLDRQEHINKFNSAEYGAIGIDQAEEVTKDDIMVLISSLRMTLNDQPLPYKELYTANPRICWLKDEFITNPKSNTRFIPALPSDNPHLPDDYLTTLQEAFGHRPELLRAYRDGDWTGIEGINQVILDVWVERAIGRPTLLGGEVISCDVARFGDDKTIIMILHGSNIVEQFAMGYSRTTEVSDRLTELSRRHNDISIVVDEIGVGGGVIDELHKNGRHVISFNSSAKADDPEKYYNLRAEAWWELGHHFAQGEIGCSEIPQELRSQLTSVCYDFRNGKILIEPKETIKQNIGKSPDEADAYVMGIWAVKRVQPTIQYANQDTKQLHKRNMYSRSFARTG